MTKTMTPPPSPSPEVHAAHHGPAAGAGASHAGLLPSLVRLARPHQWAKGAFVVIGPLYAVASGTPASLAMGLGVVAAFMAFAFASSSCYVVNDIRDVEADRLHPRKRFRPIASGAVPVATAWTFAMTLGVLAAAMVAASLLPAFLGLEPALGARPSVAWLAAMVVLYVVNTNLYSAVFKHQAVLDVISERWATPRPPRRPGRSRPRTPTSCSAWPSS
jgi:decaprenyl-phosphate phosphoribosyltransferase